jgi:hypothetical protein
MNQDWNGLFLLVSLGLPEGFRKEQDKVCSYPLVGLNANRESEVKICSDQIQTDIGCLYFPLDFLILTATTLYSGHFASES